MKTAVIPRSRRRSITLALLLALLTVGLVSVGVRPALATTTQCSGFTACETSPYTDHGWGSNYTNSYWSQDSGHNCTNYVAYYEQTVNSMSATKPSWLGTGNADVWWGRAAGNVTESQTPVVGAVAWWGDYSWNGDDGHVGIVESVSNNGRTIDVSMDSYPSGPYQWDQINSTDSDTSAMGWPGGFIYLGGVGSSSSSSPLPGPYMTMTSTGANAAYAIDNNGNLYTTWQSTSGGSWNTWSSLGGSSIGSDNTHLAAGSPIYMTVTSGGANAAYAVAEDGNLFTTWQSTSGGSWNTWASLGGSSIGTDSTHLVAGSPVYATVTSSGANAAYAIAEDGNLYTTWQSTAGGSWNTWSSLGGSSLSDGGHLVAGSPIYMTVTSSGANAAYAIDSNGNLYTTWQSTAGGSWNTWASLGGSSIGTDSTHLVAGSPVYMTVTSSGANAAYAIAADGNLFTTWQSTSGGSWNTWASLGGSSLSDGGHLVAGSPVYMTMTSSGANAAYAIDSDGNLFTTWQSTSGGSWNTWASLGGSSIGSDSTHLVAGSPVYMTVTSGGANAAYGIAADGNLFTTWQSTSGGSWNTWASLNGSSLSDGGYL